MKKTLSILLGFSILFSLSCEKRRHSLSPLEIVQERIEKKEYDQAEIELRALQIQEPDNDRVRILLASVDLARAGISVHEYFSMQLVFAEKATLFSNFPAQRLAEFLARSSLSPDSPLYPVQEAAKGLGLFSQEALEISERFEKIPNLSDEQFNWVEKALQELVPIAHPEASMSLYRGIVRTFLLKARWQRGYFFKLGDHQLCESQISSLLINVENLQNFVSFLLWDLANGMPSSQADILKKRDQWIQISSDLQKNLRLALEKGPTLIRVFEELSHSAKPATDLKGFQCDF